MSLSKKTYLITGAAKGLGAELAKQLAQNGHSVVLLDKDNKALNDVYDEIKAAGFEDNIALYPMDLLGANEQDFIELAQILEQNYTALNGVFLNAAILPAFTPIENFDYKQWYEVMQTNLNANFHLIQQLLKLLHKEQSCLVAITDNNLEQHPAYYGAYAVAKAGLAQLIKIVAAENSELNCFEARLNTFATEARGRLFPGENPTKLTQVNEVASALIDCTINNANTNKYSKISAISKV